MSKGLDYAFYPHPSVAAIKAEGAVFVCRYTSAYAPSDAQGKNLLAAEKDALLAAGISIVIVAEEDAGRMLGGTSAGVADAAHADAVVHALGMPALPVYFACDFDATTAQQAAINAYLDGAASVIGRNRVGIYGGFYPVKRALDAGKAVYAWQSYAWSGTPTLWDGRAQLRQTQNDVKIGGADCDRDVSMAVDYGQWPRPGGETVDATISEGATGAGVLKAQGRLNRHSANPAVVVDGAFGPATTTAVKSFQTRRTLTVDGTVGPLTWAALNAAPLVPGQLAAPAWLATDHKRLPICWAPVPGATGYTAVAYGIDGKEYARAATVTATWCVLDGLAPGGTYTVKVWANGGKVAPAGAELTVTLPA